ncbi:MAG: M36 family metallopeptidase [Bdellovibrionales bacterium]|nr:M36 family metallopeptidase [Bdellovibrionales bacterium]
MRGATRDFFEQYFSGLPAGFTWKNVREISDHTHTHMDFDLQYAGLPVLESRLRLHYNRNGYIDYATNPISHPFVPPRQSKVRFFNQADIAARYATLYRRGNGRFKVTAEAAYYFKKDGSLVRVFDVFVLHAQPISTRHFIVDAVTGEVLEEKRAYRFADATHKVYVVHPDRAALSIQTLGNTDGLTVLSDGSTFHVRRMPLDTSYPSIEIKLNTDFTAAGGFDSTNHDGGNYDAACTSTATDGCPNQSFDALNVYYHLREYRTNLDSYLTTLGLGSSVTFTLDPLEVVINMLAFDLNGVSGGLDEANNAFYTSSSLDVQGNIRKGLFFLRPADTSASSSICPSTVFLNLAREGAVIVHEYQHYITDLITAMVPGSDTANVGDALHEGYSDYIGASQINRLNSESSPLVTEIGEFAFKNCAEFRRDIGQLKVYSDTTSSTPQNDFSDPHIAGWTWASGLWNLRESLGRATTDLLVVKSLFFLSTQPGFLESIEALVQADEALNSGANVSTIRNLFYSQLKFVGSLNTSLFKDQDSLLFEMGFNSCLGVPRGARSLPTFLGGLLWILFTLGWGRRQCRE